MNRTKKRQICRDLCTASLLIGIAMLSETVVWADSTVPDAGMGAEIRLQGRQAMNEMASMNKRECFWLAQLQYSLNEYLAEYRKGQVRFASNEHCQCDATIIKQ